LGLHHGVTAVSQFRTNPPPDASGTHEKKETKDVPWRLHC
jgi:hypothetical protein